MYEKYYKELSFFKKIKYLFSLKNKDKYFFYSTTFFALLFLSLIYYDGNLFTFKSFIIIFFLFCFYFFIYKILIAFQNRFILMYSMQNIFLTDFKQKKYYNEFIAKNNTVKNLIFIINTKDHKSYLKKEKYLYFFSLYHTLKYLKEYQTHKYITYYIIKTFLLSSIAFTVLTIFINSIDITNFNPDFLFIFSVFYIVYFLAYIYIPYLDKTQDRFFYSNIPRNLLRKDSDGHFLITDNFLRVDEDKKKSADVLAIVFGVLFTLYTTLAFNLIYTISVKIV